MTFHSFTDHANIVQEPYRYETGPSVDSLGISKLYMWHLLYSCCVFSIHVQFLCLLAGSKIIAICVKVIFCVIPRWIKWNIQALHQISNMQKNMATERLVMTLPCQTSMCATGGSRRTLFYKLQRNPGNHFKGEKLKSPWTWRGVTCISKHMR
jgi:hypothetical protein